MRAIPVSGAGGVRGAAAAFGARRIAISAVVLLVSAFGGYQVYQRFAPKEAVAPPVQTAQAAQRTLVERASLPGTIGAGRQARLSFSAAAAGVSVSGTVQAIPVRTGDSVKAGQEVARLDTTNLDLAVLTARNSYEIARLRMQQLLDGALPADEIAAVQSVLSATSSLENAKTTLVNAQSALDLLQGRNDTVSQASAAQRADSAMRAQASAAQAEIDPLIARIVAAGGLAAGTRSALNELDSAIRVRCNSIANRDRCAAVAAGATDLTSLVAALDGGMPQIPAPIATSLAELERYATNADFEALRAPAFRLLQATASQPGLAARANNLTSLLGSAAGVPTADALANAIRARDSAASSLEAAEAALRAATLRRDQTLAGPLPLDVKVQEQTVSQAEIALRRALNDQKGATLYAPFDGVIGAITMNVGEPSGSGAIILIDPLSMQLNATAQESDVGKLKVGQTVNLTFDALSGSTLPGRVATIAPAADVQQGVASYAVVVEVVRAAGGNQQAAATAANLRAGMTGTASVEIARRENVLAIPTRALRRQGRNTVVEVQVGAAAETRLVRTGGTDGTFTEILEGLTAGDVVVIPVATTTTSPTGTGGAGTGGGFPGGAVPGGGQNIIIAPGKGG